MNYEVRFIAKQWGHHSNHSGYHQMVPLLGTPVSPLDLSSVRHTWIPGRVAVKLAQRSGVSHYSYTAFFDEWSAARDMINHNQSTIYHVLYGDESYRYLGRMRLRKTHRVVATFHQPPSYLEQAIQNPTYLRTLDGIVVVARNQLSFFRSEVDSSRLFWVPHGVNTDVFRPLRDFESGKRQNNRCLFVGMHKRDFNTLSAVIEIVGEKVPDVEFCIVTAESNAHLFASKLNVRFFCGISEAQLIALYQSSTLFLQPLSDSTANNSILEAMSCGLPIVATDVGGVRDYVDEKCGALVSRGDPKHMANIVLELLFDNQRRYQMAENARTHSLQFDWNVVAGSMRRVYQAII